MKMETDDKIALSIVAVAGLVFAPILLTALLFVLSFGIIVVPTYVGFFTMYSTVCWVWVVLMTYIWAFTGTSEE